MAEGADRGMPLVFQRDPLRAYGLVFRIVRCELPSPGLYWVEFRFNGAVLSREPIVVKAR